MANDLTGDFDVVAQFGIPAVNRVLAAMHRIERFQHSFSVHVDDTPPPWPHHWNPTVTAVVDSLGESIADPGLLGNPSGWSGGPRFGLDAIVNDLSDAGIAIDPIVPSNLKGRAQVQLHPPTIELGATSATQITVRMGIMARYFPDPGTSALAEYIVGDLRIGAPVNQVVWQNGNVIDIDLKANSLVVNFTPSWSSKALTAEDLAGITQLVRNSLRTSFVPTNAPLPAKISHMQFKTLAGPPGVVSVLLDLEGGAGNQASAHTVFVTLNDGFAIGVGADYIQSAFQPTLTDIATTPVDPVHFKIDAWFHTWNVTYTITLNSAALNLENGKMVVVIQGHAHTDRSWLPDFDFTARQNLTIAVSGSSAELVVGDLTLDTSSWIADHFKGGAIANMETVRDKALADNDVQNTVRHMLSADENLGGFLRSLLKPAEGSSSTETVNFTLDYTSAEIRTSGIVLHGDVAVDAWPLPRVAFEMVPQNSGPMGGAAGGAVLDGPEYSALKSWIPGGSIERFEWHDQGSAQGYSETHKFTMQKGPMSTMASASASTISASASTTSGAASTTSNAASNVLSRFTPLCLTIHGTRLSASGPITTESVSGTVCAYNSFPFPGGLNLGDARFAPMISLAKRGANGLVEITGHAEARVDRQGNVTPNMLVHFVDERSGNNLDVFSKAVQASKRPDAATAIIVVMAAGAVGKTRFSEGLTFIEDDDGIWRRRFGVKSGAAATVLVDPGGKELWRKEGAVDAAELSSVLGKLLVDRVVPEWGLVTPRVRVGQAPPNFLFEYAPGLDMTLRKLQGRRVLLVFWRRSLSPSVEILRNVTASKKSRDAKAPLVLAINDGESPDVARSIARELRDITVVPDQDRRIARAYGVTMWPTSILLDEFGKVTTITYGRSTGGANNA